MAVYKTCRLVTRFIVALMFFGTTITAQEPRNTGDFLYNKGVEMKCRHGYDMFGSRQLKCNGEMWSIKVHKCKPRCSDPGVPKNGFALRSPSLFKHGARIEFNCSESYTLQGPSSIECKDGRWNNGLPKCLAEAQINQTESPTNRTVLKLNQTTNAPKPVTTEKSKKGLCQDVVKYCRQIKDRGLCSAYRPWCCETCGAQY